MIDFDGPVSNWLPTVWYGGYLPDMPDLCVGQLPRGFGREWKIWIVETPREQMALTEALRLPITRRGLSLDFSATLDAAVRSPGTGRPFIGLYPPPESGWPWIVIGRFDKTIGAALGLARGVPVEALLENREMSVDAFLWNYPTVERQQVEAVLKAVAISAMRDEV